MRIIFDDEIDGEKFVPIGRIKAASGWHGPRSAVTNDFYKAKALENLIDAAEDCDADAIIEVDYDVDRADVGDAPGASLLQRVSVTGLAVKLARS
jgi:uncharacterized protein YbjQ (UPF0145 family)